MLKTGKTYRTIVGDKKFFIHSTRNKPVSNGCNFIGEDLKTGTLVCFDYKGKHPWEEKFNLECDPYTWCGLLDGGKFATKKFVKAKDLEFTYTHYLRMERGDPTTIVCMDRSGFEFTYI